MQSQLSICPTYRSYRAFASIQIEADGLPQDHRLNAQRKIRLWYWASVFTNRYSGSVESTSARDYLDISRNGLPKPRLNRDFSPTSGGVLGRLIITRETRKGTSVYNGIFNLDSVQRGPRLGHRQCTAAREISTTITSCQTATATLLPCGPQSIQFLTVHRSLGRPTVRSLGIVCPTNTCRSSRLDSSEAEVLTILEYAF